MTEQDIEKMDEDDFGIEEIDLYQTYKKAVKPKIETEEDEPINIWKEIGSFVGPFVLAFVVAVFLKEYIIINADIPSGSMENTIMTGDRLIGNRLAYLFGEPERGDIIIFKYPDDETQLFVKRIIGMPGETVYIDPRGTIYINGEALQESYGREIIQSAGLAEEEMTLGEDEYFVLGDNRNNSSDSRDPYVGNIHKEDILGKAWIRIWPLSKMEVLDHQ